MRDESVSRVDETNSVATSLITTRRSGESTRRIGPIHDEMIWEVDETNSVHNETNRNNDSTTRNANLVSDLTSYLHVCPLILLFLDSSLGAGPSLSQR